ncbi:TRAP transporter small permease [Flavilitoribacter nigricans]|uniref:TRAP transporter permease DctM/Q n=1 Tax=Flavilitoribacter nigricans (strain ATCC 23147 / DSM 23189 / NBRC 102662 / NCIMB 1420 / SS-2) TaxID=1122177 RepID=A0A2D0NAH1_FLAN2|nr:TRAP transporter small permease [Flavilitoribacter nigricans]PHN05504.1 TRAP transporter permease DctM/Q [Flavilitoribacter nigricans DSM 23189 = NBRC 102662]
MAHFIDRYFKLLQGLLTIMLCVLVVPVLIQVLSRFLPFIPRYIWTEEIARFAFIWIILIGSSIAVRDQSHFHVDILPKFSPKTEHNLRVILLMLMLLLAIVFVAGGFQFALFGLTQSSEISGLPMLTIYIAWPLAGLSWMLFLVEQIYQHFNHQEKS